MFKKKLIFGLLFLLSFTLGAFEFSPLTLEKPDFLIIQDMAFNFSDDSRSENVETSSYLFITTRELRGDFGFVLAQNRLEGTLKFIYEPFRFEKVALGPCFTYHVYRYFDIFTEQDFLPGVYVDYFINPAMTLSFFLDALFKYSDIDDAMSLWTTSFATGLNFSYNIREDFGVNAYMGTIDFFDIMLPATLFLDFGIYKNISRRVFGAVDVYTKFTDIICIYPYPAQAGLKLSWGINL